MTTKSPRSSPSYDTHTPHHWSVPTENTYADYSRIRPLGNFNKFTVTAIKLRNFRGLELQVDTPGSKKRNRAILENAGFVISAPQPAFTRFR